MSPRVWPEIVRPMLADRQGWALFIGTPMGRNHFCALYEQAMSEPDWLAQRFPASETGILQRTELDAARRTMSSQAFAQEFECSFAAGVPGAYYAALLEQAENDGRIGRVPWEPRLPVLASDKGCEINFTTAGVTMNLLPAATAGNGAVIGVRNSAGSGDVTIDPNGAETLDGLATRLLRPGDCVLLRCDGSNWRTVSGAYSFESAEQTLALSTAIAVAHGLGVKPNSVRAVFRCKTSEGNWAVGDEVDYNALIWTYGGAIAADATTAIAALNQTYAPNLSNKTTGVGMVMTYANWRLVIYCKDLRG
ncbi:MAG: hypothetical protein HYU58_00175 [Proteobacteria bacterium]|nr:hypothetical protein [Pseudomonadota bacterium]